MDDIRDTLEPQGSNVKLYPYAKNLFYHPSGVLSMTVQVYDDIETQEFSFGFNAHGTLKEFLDQVFEGPIL